MDRLLRKRMRLAPTTWDKVESEPGALPNLFLRFPVKTLSRCKTVCSRWCQDIRSPSFEEKQLSVSKAKPTYVVYPYVDEVTNVYMVDADGEVIEKVTLPGCDNLPFLSMTCSYSGLVCLTNSPWDSDFELSRVDYSGLEIRMCSPQCIMDSHNMFVDGKVYWFLPSEEDHRIAGPILSVDMEDKFRVIELPEEVTEHAFLVNLDGHLGLVAIYDDDVIMDAWLLKYDDEANDYWDKKCSDYIPYPTTECPDSVAGRDSELFVITTEHYFIYDIGSMIWLELDFSNEFERNCPAVFSFTESLFPCDGDDNI